MKHLILSTLALVFLLSFTSGSAASTREFTFTHINEQFGISVREITAVTRDDNGFIWAASRTGILRVAADNYRLYQLPFATTDVMQVKMSCRGNRLVAATQNGQLFRYNPIRDTFDPCFSLSSQLGTDNWVTNLLIDADGKTWISTNTGIFTWTGSESIHPFPLPGEERGVSFIAPADSGQILAFTQSSVWRIDTRRATSQRLQGRMPHLISSARYDARHQRLWIGTYNAGLWQYDVAGQKLSKAAVPDFPRLIVRDILMPDSTSLWIGIDGGGIWILDSEANQVKQVLREDIDNPTSLRGNSVHSLLTDDRQRVWAATNSGGLQYTETARPPVEHLAHGINNPQSLHNNQVNSLLTDSFGNLWMATDDGISRRDARTREWTQLYGGRQQVFLSLAADHRGHIYAGTYGKGLYVLDAATGREVRHYTGRQGNIFGPGGFVFATFTDSQGDVWMGGVRDSVYCYHPSDGQLRTYDAQPVYCFAELSPGQILMGCAYGLLLLDKETGKFDVLVSNHTVQDIAVEGHTVWICTSGDGVIGIDMRTARQTHVTTQWGLPSNYTKSLLQVGNDLWIGTDNGLCCLNLPDRMIRSFATSEWLSNVAFSVNAACHLPDGRLAFGTNQGAVLFHPSELETIYSSGRIYFSDLRVSGRSIRQMPDFNLATPVDSLATLCLRYPQNSFTLSVLPLGHISKSVTFSWKLLGQDKEWSAYTANRYINYTNLPAGDYTLCIRLYDGTILSQRQMEVSVLPPFWQTTWFRLLVAGIILALLFFIARYYVLRLHRRYADEKIRFFTRMAHDIRTSLMLIKAPVEELHKEKDCLSPWGARCLDLAAGETARLTATATQLLDFEKLDIGREQPLFSQINMPDLVSRRIGVHQSGAAERQIDITASLTPEHYWARVDARMMERVVDNLLSNAVKYSLPGGRIEVAFYGKPDGWTLRVRDYGIGISMAAQRKLFREFYRSDNAVNAQIVGSGIGLLMTKKYVALHDGKISVTSETDKGTTFDISVPLHCAADTGAGVDPEATPLTGAPDAAGDAAAASAASPAAASSVSSSVSPAVNEAAETPDMHILLVEDNRALREFMVHPLSRHFRITTATDGQQAWEMLASLQPDLVVSDIVMPRMDGFELCRRIKSTYETSHIPVILLTALSDKSNQLHGLGLGADNYLVKPFDMALLASRITSIIRNRRTVFQKAIEAQRDDTRSIVENRINDEFIKKAVACVRANMANEDFGKEDFASALALSQSLLYKKIKALTNLSVVEFIREIRLNHAMELLRGGEHNVTEVSELCGFSSPAYFSKVFKEHFGKTPTEVK